MESRRVDNQARGRSGRQGDEGCSIFFVSLENYYLLKGINIVDIYMKIYSNELLVRFFVS